MKSNNCHHRNSLSYMRNHSSSWININSQR
jgi:hypothetical protein